MKRKATKETPAWRDFESLGAQIQRKLAPTATVTEHERIKGASGVVRTIDITVRQQLSAYPALVTVDCKLHTRRVGVSYIAACAEQARDVGANIAVVVSNSGFTKGARNVARVNRVILQTLREATAADWQKVVRPNAFTTLTRAMFGDASVVVLMRSGERFTATLNTPTFDAAGTELKTIEMGSVRVNDCETAAAGI